MDTYVEPTFRALADPSRRAIFELLGGGARSVVELAGDLPISRPAVSQHLKVLKDCGLVSVRPAGTRRIYAIDPDGVRAARDYFDRFWTTSLASFASAVRDSTDSTPKPERPETEEQQP